MAFSYTSDDLIASVKRRARVPTSQSTFTNSDFLELADEEIGVGLLPLIMKVRENYYLAEKDHTITSGTASYAIPARAVGDKLKALKIVDSSGNERPVNRIEYEERHMYDGRSAGNPVFYVKGNSVVLVPTPNASGGTLRMAYFLRPSTCVLESAAGQVTAINTGTNEVTVSTLPSTVTPGTAVDFVKQSGGFACLAVDQPVSSVAGSTLTFSSLPTGLSVGDYVALAGETPIPQVPAELHAVLALRVAVTVLLALGFQSEAGKLQAKLEEAEKAVLTLISPRVDGAPKKIRNHKSLLASRTRAY